MSDLTLQQAVMQALADNPHVRPDEISAQVVGGDVTLHGTVGSVIQRDEAETSTRAVPGVGHIDNRLRVRILDSDHREDADTQAAVMDALIADGGLHDAALDVRAEEGTVTLRGSVAGPEQRQRAVGIAMSVPGVEHVHNRLDAGD